MLQMDQDFSCSSHWMLPLESLLITDWKYIHCFNECNLLVADKLFLFKMRDWRIKQMLFTPLLPDNHSNECVSVSAIYLLTFKDSSTNNQGCASKGCLSCLSPIPGSRCKDRSSVYPSIVWTRLTKGWIMISSRRFTHIFISGSIVVYDPQRSGGSSCMGPLMPQKTALIRAKSQWSWLWQVISGTSRTKALDQIFVKNITCLSSLGDQSTWKYIDGRCWFLRNYLWKTTMTCLSPERASTPQKSRA